MVIAVRSRLTKTELSVLGQEKAQRAVDFITSLKHVTGKWAGKPFRLLPWQEKIVRDVFGTLRPDGFRQFREVYIEVPKKNGKSEFGSAIALYLLFWDNEARARVYSAAADKKQAGIVFDVAAEMVNQELALLERGKVIDSVKRIVNYENAGWYDVLSSEAFSKHGYNVSGVIFDELHAQPNRELFDVLTTGSGAAREQPLFAYLTTAGVDRNSICWEVHEKARQILNGSRNDPEFYPVIYALEDDDDWTDEANWYRVNPSLGEIIKIADLRHDFHEAEINLAEENLFRQLRLDQWVASSIRWMRMSDWDKACGKYKAADLKGRKCYAGLDLSSTLDLTALAYVFPPVEKGEPYKSILRFWIPEDTMRQKEKRDRVPYSKWVKAGWLKATPGNVIDYKYIISQLEADATEFEIAEVAYDPWGASKIAQDLDEKGFTMVEERQGFKTLSPPMKDLMNFILSEPRQFEHSGNPVLRWNVDNTYAKQDEAGNQKPDKKKSTQRIDGTVALIMGLDRAIRHSGDHKRSAYEDEVFTIG